MVFTNDLLFKMSKNPLNKPVRSTHYRFILFKLSIFRRRTETNYLVEMQKEIYSFHQIEVYSPPIENMPKIQSVFKTLLSTLTLQHLIRVSSFNFFSS